MRGTLATRSTRRFRRGLILDSFTRADAVSTPGRTELGDKAWEAITGTWGIISNTLYCSTSTGSGGNVCAVETRRADFELSFRWSNDVNAGGAFRIVDGTNFLMWLRVGGGVNMYSSIAGAIAPFGTGVAAAAAGDVDRIVGRGPMLAVYRNGGLLVPFLAGPAFANATKHGLVTNGATAPRFDDVRIAGLP